jgi:hypothetical protein
MCLLSLIHFIICKLNKNERLKEIVEFVNASQGIGKYVPKKLFFNLCVTDKKVYLRNNKDHSHKHNILQERKKISRVPTI